MFEAETRDLQSLIWLPSSLLQKRFADQPHALAFASRLLPAHIWDPGRPLVAEKGWDLGLL